MIRVLLLQGKGSDLLAPYVTSQIEVDLKSAFNIESALQISKKKTFDIILVPAPDYEQDSSYGLSLTRWLMESKNSLSPPVFITYYVCDSSIILTDVTSGMVLLDSGPSASVSCISALRMARSRRTLERSLRNECDIQRWAIMTMPIAFVRALSQAIVQSNHAMETLSGYNAEDLTGNPVSDIIVNRKELEARREDATLITSSGQQIPVRITREDSLNLEKEGQIYFIEDRREVESLQMEVRETLQVCREKLWLSETLILKLAPDGTITFVNNAALTTFGYTENLAGCHVSLLLPPVSDPDPLSIVSQFLDVANESEPTAIHIMEHQRNDGGKIYIAWTTRAYYNALGELSGLLCVGTDMTEHTPQGEGRISTRIWRDRIIEGTDILPEVFDAILQACVEIAREGREGKSVGTAFLVGDSSAVMERSRQLILNPFHGHPPDMLIVTRKDVREMLKEYALLDGAFVVSGAGFLEAAGRYITVDASSASLPKGMGTRHSSTAAISSVTRTIGFVVSESGGRVSVIKDGKIVNVIG
jgi:PAS domain S-box-containing protein